MTQTATRHGTPSGYRAGCRCEECRAANNKRKSVGEKRRLLGAPSPNDRLPVHRARQWVEYLQSQGMTVSQIETAAGVTDQVLTRVTTGRSKKNPNTEAKITRSSEKKILAVQPVEVRDTTQVPAELTWRRIRSLQALGYGLGWIGEQIGKKSPNGSLYIRQNHVFASTARAVAELCQFIGDTPGPSRRARLYAAQRGWLPPAYYDDDLQQLAA